MTYPLNARPGIEGKTEASYTDIVVRQPSMTSTKPSSLSVWSVDEAQSHELGFMPNRDGASVTIVGQIVNVILFHDSHPITDDLHPSHLNVYPGDANLLHDSMASVTSPVDGLRRTRRCPIGEAVFVVRENGKYHKLGGPKCSGQSGLRRLVVTMKQRRDFERYCQRKLPGGQRRRF